MIQLALTNLWIEDTRITKAKPTTNKKPKKKRPKSKKKRKKSTSSSSSSSTESESSDTEESSAEYETVDNEIEEVDTSISTYNRKLQQIRSALQTRQLLEDIEAKNRKQTKRFFPNLADGITKANETEGIAPKEHTIRRGGRNTGAIPKTDRNSMSSIATLAADVPEVPAAGAGFPAATEAVSDRSKKVGKKKK